MRIAIVGAGAMGCLFGAYLIQAGVDVALVDIWPEQVDSLRRQGLEMRQKEAVRHFCLPVYYSSEPIPAADLAILFVKSADTLTAARSLQSLLKEDGRVLTLQNGLGNAELIASVVGTARVMVGTTAQGATLIQPGVIYHAGEGETHFGRLGGSADAYCRQVALLLTQAGIPSVAHDDVRSLVWGKLVINCGINAFTGLLNCQNGKLNELPETRELVRMAVEEAVAVAKAANIALPYADPCEKVLSVAVATAGNQSSLLQDLLRGRTTEVEMINGAIVREGRRFDIATPVNQLLTLLVRAKEKLSLQADESVQK